MTLRNYVQSLAVDKTNKDILFFYGEDVNDRVMICIRNGDIGVTKTGVVKKYLEDEILVIEDMNPKSCHAYLSGLYAKIISKPAS